ncbi:Replication factor C subunit 2 [Spathaspora sp. JA1]|nr:Replication factor C subunit 2 [Spathaspora sp. JA1]
MTDQYEQERLDHTPWVEKYRPKNLDDIASQEHAVTVLKRTLATANLPHMLFYGPPGTGKTSTILALAKQLYGPNLSKSRVLELNASDERGINIVRSKIKNFARLTISNPSAEDLAQYPCPPYKIIILDEADSMTNDAQSALRRTMETYSGVTRFCLICNYITRIIDPLASRCSKFRFKLLNNNDGLLRLKYIAEQEQLNLNQDEDVLQQVLDISDGDLRKAITFLQSASKLSNSLNHQISNKLIRETAGVLYQDIIESLVNILKQQTPAKVIEFVNEIILQGWSIQQLLSQLHDRLILDDSIDSIIKNQIAILLFETDKRLNNGSDEHIQLLNLSLQISKVM